MTKEFKSLEEIKKYYNKEINTYVFKENGEYIDLVVFNFDLDVTANISACNISVCNINARNISACNINANDINAWNIYARDIITRDINACDINAWNIYADNIDYYAVCFAYYNIKCKSIKGRRKNTKHFVLDGKLEVEQ